MASEHSLAQKKRVKKKLPLYTKKAYFTPQTFKTYDKPLWGNKENFSESNTTWHFERLTFTPKTL